MSPRIKKNNPLENQQAAGRSSDLNTAAAGGLKSTNMAEHSPEASLLAVGGKGLGPQGDPECWVHTAKFFRQQYDPQRAWILQMDPLKK